jgi:hypothetical protein
LYTSTIFNKQQLPANLILLLTVFSMPERSK